MTCGICRDRITKVDPPADVPSDVHLSCLNIALEPPRTITQRRKLEGEIQQYRRGLVTLKAR